MGSVHGDLELDLPDPEPVLIPALSSEGLASRLLNW